MLNKDEVPMNNMILNPIEVSSSDPGDETQKRFRYQHTFSTLVAIRMHSGELPYKELYCEQMVENHNTEEKMK